MFKKMEGEGVEWIQLLQDSENWQAFVITVVNSQVSYNTVTFSGYLRIYKLLRKGSTPCS